MKKLSSKIVIIASIVMTFFAFPTGVKFANASPVSHTGETVTLGRFEQDGNLENGAEPIQWTVIEDIGGCALLLSDYNLVCMSYLDIDIIVDTFTDTYDQITWENSSLRSWLNNDFYESAFDSDEKLEICDISLSNPDNYYYGTPGGNDTTDKVFLLSLDDADCLSSRIKISTNTKYAWDSASTKPGEGAGIWWLRTPGETSRMVAIVEKDGTINASGESPNMGGVVVRPAMYVYSYMLDSVNVDSYLASASTNSAIATGDQIAFGRYEQDNCLSNGSEPIQWRVLSIDNDKALLISEFILDCYPYNTSRTWVRWENCSLRAWLNSDFFVTAFTPEECSAILSTYNTTAASRFGISGGGDTVDNVFLLSLEQVGAYLRTNEERNGIHTEYSLAHGASNEDGNGAGWWWLRTPGDSDVRAACIYALGGIIETGGDVNDTYRGVRPVISISLSAITASQP